jgi:hypothetical protein
VSVVDIVQTIALVVATAIALLTYFAADMNEERLS